MAKRKIRITTPVRGSVERAGNGYTGTSVLPKAGPNYRLPMPTRVMRVLPNQHPNGPTEQG